MSFLVALLLFSERKAYSSLIPKLIVHCHPPPPLFSKNLGGGVSRTNKKETYIHEP